jgi:peptidoglycan hydrolase CwlO-like protein
VQSRPRRPFTLVAATVLVFTIPALPSGAAEDPEDERDRVRQEQDELESELDVLRASEDEIAAELDRLAGEVAGAEAELANAQAAVDAAEAEVQRLDDQLADLDAELEDLEAQFREAAVQTYIDGGAGDPLGGLTELELNDAAVRQALRDVARGDLQDLHDALRNVRSERQAARQDAEDARAETEVARDAASSRLSDLRSAQEEQQTVASDVEARINNALYEAAALEDLDADLSEEIRAQQRELAERLPPPPPPPTTDEAPGGDTPAGPPSPPPNFPSPPGGIVTVAGIQVSATIAAQVEGLMAQAAADGVPLAGRGYRSAQEQIELRMENCGTSYYAIYEMPPTQCNPETALPGQSNHELGLAIDFTWGGQSIETHSHPGFQWLAANATAFGFANLPSEPWHWSPDGT